MFHFSALAVCRALFSRSYITPDLQFNCCGFYFFFRDDDEDESNVRKFPIVEEVIITLTFNSDRKQSVVVNILFHSFN